MDRRAVPFLWFRSEAEEAARRYVELLDGTILDVNRAGGAVMTVTFEILGLRVVALNGNRDQPFTDAFSVLVPCDTQAEIDRLWEGFLEGGGRENRCGWLRDRWGVAWQIVPANLPALLSRPGAVQRMMGMNKLVIAELEGP